MQFSTITALSAVLLGSMVQTAPIEVRQDSTCGQDTCGQLTIVNKCGFPIALNIDNQVNQPPRSTTIAAGADYTEDMQVNGNTGNTWKLSKEDDPSNIVQVEYTVGSTTLWWDLSLINGNPFGDRLQNMVTDCQDPSHNHGIAQCAANADPCGDAYNVWNDDKIAMRDSALGSNLWYTACADA